MSIRLVNNSISVVVRGYAIALWPVEDKKPGRNSNDTAKEVDREPVLVWVDIAPQHPKALNAIWASLVNGTGEYLDIYDRVTNEQQHARGLNRRYHRLQADAPSLAGRARPKHLRLIAPEACRIEDYTKPFVVLEWPGLPCGTALAAMLEHGSPYPIRIGWGDYLLNEAIARRWAHPLITGGHAPIGYLLDPAPWPDIISDGIKRRMITLEGASQIQSLLVNADSVFGARQPVASR